MAEQEHHDAAGAAEQDVSGSNDTEFRIKLDQDSSEPTTGAEQSPDDGTIGSDSGNEEDRSVELEQVIADLQKENSELKDQYLRKQADFENYRRRMARDKEDAVSFANQQILLDLTSIIDDFERAIQSADESRDYDAFHNGVELIERQLLGTLERKWGLSRFESEGQPFDPQRHEAVMSEPREDHSESLVLQDFQKGFLLHDRVLRSAKVKVSTPTGSSE